MIKVWSHAALIIFYTATLPPSMFAVMKVYYSLPIVMHLFFFFSMMASFNLLQ